MGQPVPQPKYLKVEMSKVRGHCNPWPEDCEAEHSFKEKYQNSSRWHALRRCHSEFQNCFSCRAKGSIAYRLTLKKQYPVSVCRTISMSEWRRSFIGMLKKEKAMEAAYRLKSKCKNILRKASVNRYNVKMLGEGWKTCSSRQALRKQVRPLQDKLKSLQSSWKQSQSVHISLHEDDKWN